MSGWMHMGGAAVMWREGGAEVCMHVQAAAAVGMQGLGGWQLQRAGTWRQRGRAAQLDSDGGPVREHTRCSPASNKMNRAILAARQFQVEEKSFSAPSLGRRKGAACPPCFAVVAIHNAVNERAWREILRWEAAHGGTPPRLVRFRCGSGRAVPGLPPGKCLGGVGWSLARGREAVVGRKAVDKLWGWGGREGHGVSTLRGPWADRDTT